MVTMWAKRRSVWQAVRILLKTGTDKDRELNSASIRSPAMSEYLQKRGA